MRISRSIYAVFEADFASIDVDSSGALDKSEITRLLEKQHGTEPSTDAVEAFLTSLDTDSDGKISLSEYIRGLLGSDRVQRHAGVCIPICRGESAR